MPECSNPVQCQIAKRLECTCGCGGANHSKLRPGLDSSDPPTKLQAEEQLTALKQQQSELKKQHRIERRKKRAAARKVSA